MSTDSRSLLSTPLIDDFHIHLRDGQLMETVVPHLKEAGIGRCYVMPNLIPPVSSHSHAMTYRDSLQLSWMKACPQVPRPDFKMLLFLDKDMSPTQFSDARDEDNLHVAGIKSYPKGVTTNSAQGVESYESFYPIFDDLQKNGKSLHLHGEVPGIDPLQAEQKFLPTFWRLARDFPQLRIVLEHVSSAKAVEAVQQLGPNVAATVTPQHAMFKSNDVFHAAFLQKHHRDQVITRSDVKNDHLFCKPCLKEDADRTAIQEAIFKAGPSNQKFFFGSDSAPHWEVGGKDNPCCPAAGCYSAPVAGESFVALALSLAEDWDDSRSALLQRTSDFLSQRGSAFFGIDAPVRGQVEYFMDDTSKENVQDGGVMRDGLFVPNFTNPHGIRVVSKANW